MFTMTEAWFDPISRELVVISEDAVTLRHYLTDDQFKDADSTIEPEDTHQKWEVEAVLAMGRLVVDALRDETTTLPFTEDHLRRMQVANLLPSRKFIVNNFGSFSEFRRAIEATRPRPSSDFDTVTKPEIYNMVFETHRKYGGDQPLSIKLLTMYHNFGHIPSYKYLYNRFGGVRELNEFLGYPNVAKWDMHDFVQYGVRIIEVNGQGSLTRSNVDALAKDKHGPYSQLIYRRFGSWDTYRHFVAEEYERYNQAKRIRQRSIDKHFQEVDYITPVPDGDQERRAIWARYLVAQSYAHALSEDAIKTLALLPSHEFVQKLQALQPRVTSCDIELAAHALNVVDDIWPPVHIRRPKLQPTATRAQLDKTEAI